MLRNRLASNNACSTALVRQCLFVPLVGSLVWFTAVRASAQGQASEPFGKVLARTTVVERQTSGYEAFRIPLILRAPNKDLLVFCEARRTESDYGNIDIVMFRSEDGGASWGPLRVLVDHGDDTACDIAGVVKDDQIHLFFQKRPGGRSFNDYTKGKANDATGHHMVSKDSGKQWSEPTDITDEILPERHKQLPMFGPNNGIVLDSGRLVVPMYYADQREDSWTPTVIYRDKGSTEWRRAEDAIVGDNINETAVVQLSNGDVYGVARDDSGDDDGRKRFLVSKDNAETWSHTGDLGGPVTGTSCQQSMVALGDRVFIADPRKPNRTEGRVISGYYEPTQPDRISWDCPPLRVTDEGFAYSSMALYEDLHLVYEKTAPQQPSYNYQALVYVRIGLQHE